MSDKIDPDSIKLPVNRKSRNGKVRVWMPETVNALGKKVSAGYVMMYSVNAREAIAYSGASLEAPEETKKRKSNKPVDAGQAANKKSVDELQSIIAEEELDVDISQFEKIGEKRDAVKVALIAKEEEER